MNNLRNNMLFNVTVFFVFFFFFKSAICSENILFMSSHQLSEERIALDDIDHPKNETEMLKNVIIAIKRDLFFSAELYGVNNFQLIFGKYDLHVLSSLPDKNFYTFYARSGEAEKSVEFTGISGGSINFDSSWKESVGYSITAKFRPIDFFSLSELISIFGSPQKIVDGYEINPLLHGPTIFKYPSKNEFGNKRLIYEYSSINSTQTLSFLTNELGLIKEFTLTGEKKKS